MEDKDVALLGFISSAQKYIEEHQEDGTSLLGLDNVNISKLKDELVKQLKFFGDKGKVEALMDDGSAAFNQYINDLSAKENALNVLGNIFSTSFDDDETFTKINKKVVKKPNEQKVKIPKNMDAVIKEVVDNEKKTNKVVQSSKKNEHRPLSETLKSFAGDEKYDDSYLETKPQNNKTVIDNNHGKLSDSLRDYSHTIIENPGLDAIKNDDYEEDEYDNYEQDYYNNYYNDEVDEQEDELEELEELASRKQKSVSNYQKQIEIPGELTERIKQVYPYLDEEFIEDAYRLRQEINYYYSIYKVVIVLHRIEFKDIERLREFVEIVSDHDYLVNVDEKQKIVDVIRSINNEEGAILTNIFTIANQAKCVEGEYIGYRVMNNDKK